MKIIEVQSDVEGAQTIIISVQENDVGIAVYFHDEDLFITDPSSISVLDPAQAFRLSKALGQAAQLASDGSVEGWDAERRRRVGAE